MMFFISFHLYCRVSHKFWWWGTDALLDLSGFVSLRSFLAGMVDVCGAPVGLSSLSTMWIFTLPSQNGTLLGPALWSNKLLVTMQISIAIS